MGSPLMGVGSDYHANLERQGAKLIHAHFAEGGPAALFLSKKLNLPLILHLHGGAELMTDANLCKKWYEWTFLAHRHSLWKRASAFLCVSEYVRGSALKAGFPPGKTHVHLTGLDCETFTPKTAVTEKDPDLVLYVGRLIPYKGCDFLIRAMQLVQRVRPRSRLVIIGDGISRRGLQGKLAKALGINCDFVGELTPAGVRRGWKKPGCSACRASPCRTDRAKHSALSSSKLRRWECRWSAFAMEAFRRPCATRRGDRTPRGGKRRERTSGAIAEVFGR